MKYCPTCDAERSPEQQDEQGRCAVCGTELLDDPAGGGTVVHGGTPPVPERPVPERPTPKRPDAQPPDAEPAEAPPGEAKPAPDEAAGPATSETDEEQASVDPLETVASPTPAAGAKGREETEGRGPEDGTLPQPGRPDAPQRPATVPPPTAPAGDDAPTRDYEGLVAEVEANVLDGYELFGLVGGPASGKTHALKALTYLLRNTGTQSDRAAFEFMQSAAPGPTGVKVAHYDYTGPSQRWTFVDAGGELYAGLRRNDWDTFAAHTTRLSRWLHRAHGLFCFLHLRPGHFGGYVLDDDPTLEDDGERRAALQERRREALENQAELAFFRNFLLFLRALKAEDGDVGRVIESCRGADSLEEALQGYDRSAPLLDVPVMFFFSQADLYERHDFAVGPGTHVNPRRLDRPANAFAARYLPTLFAGVASQVRRFKLDFLQSYEEAVTEQRGRDGEPQVKTYWSPPDDPHSYLSAGLLAGLEFVLRNQPRRRRWWEPPELTTRQALILHRRLHPGDWEGVSRGLLGSWREPAPLPAEDGGEASGEATGEAAGDGSSDSLGNAGEPGESP